LSPMGASRDRLPGGVTEARPSIRMPVLCEQAPEGAVNAGALEQAGGRTGVDRTIHEVLGEWRDVERSLERATSDEGALLGKRAERLRAEVQALFEARRGDRKHHEDDCSMPPKHEANS
jgi:hypothetical protein